MSDLWIMVAIAAPVIGLIIDLTILGLRIRRLEDRSHV